MAGGGEAAKKAPAPSSTLPRTAPSKEPGPTRPSRHRQGKRQVLPHHPSSAKPLSPTEMVGGFLSSSLVPVGSKGSSEHRTDSAATDPDSSALGPGAPPPNLSNPDDPGSRGDGTGRRLILDQQYLSQHLVTDARRSLCGCWNPPAGQSYLGPVGWTTDLKD